MLITKMPDLMEIKNGYIKSESIFRNAQHLIDNDMVTLVSQNEDQFNFKVEDRFDDFTVELTIDESGINHNCSCESYLGCCVHAAASLIMIYLKHQQKSVGTETAGEPYSRKDMIKRVLIERKEKAAKEEFNITFGENIFGIHKVKSASGRIY
ncbi:MAG: hypothetical protein V1720_07515 [bacterium]